jgi:hypothetical protein
MAANLLKELHALATTKRALRQREEKLVVDLRKVLGRLGYRIDRISFDGRGPRRRVVSREQSPASGGSKSLRCSTCGRTFSLPLHLGRHMSVMHKGQASSAPGTPPVATETLSPSVSAKPRRRMSTSARRAAAKRMKAYWRKRKTTASSKSSSMSRGSGGRRKTTRRRSKTLARPRKSSA